METPTPIKPFTPKPWKTERHELMCRLTDEEQRVRGEQLAAALKDWQAKDEEAKGIKATMKRLEEDTARLREAVLHKQELRSVDCELIADFEHDSVDTFRLDTLALVTRRQLTFSEKQPELPMDGVPAPVDTTDHAADIDPDFAMVEDARPDAAAPNQAELETAATDAPETTASKKRKPAIAKKS